MDFKLISIVLFFISHAESMKKDKFNDQQPNIIFIMADDLGWNDVSFHGSDQIMTPNIDVLAYQGIILDQYYTDSIGSASRSAFFTGKYPFRLGTQGISMTATEDHAVPLSERLLPSYLQDLGYQTHLIGKWHLGKSRKQYLPTNRGFDSFFGFLDGAVDYYTYNLIENVNNTQYFGLDLYSNFNPIKNVSGHLTDVLTDQAIRVIQRHDGSSPLYLQVSHGAPHVGGGLVNLQPTVNSIEHNKHIAHSARRMYAGLVTQLDKSIGQILVALAENKMLENTIIAFVADNGAPTVGEGQNFGSNYPLRGLKNTPWEGGLRSPAFIWYPKLPASLWSDVFHVTDWLPTLVFAAGGNITSKIDGVSLWNAMKVDKPIDRKEVVLAIDDVKGWAAVRNGDLKIVIGDLSNDTSEYYGADLLALRLDPPDYKKEILNCEATKILRDFVNMTMDFEEVLMLRIDTALKTALNVTGNRCLPTKEKGCLYNIKTDPLEMNDIWDSSENIVKQMTLRLRTLWKEIVPRSTPKHDARSNPAKYNYTWGPWLEDNATIPEKLKVSTAFPLQATRGELQYLVDLNLQSFKERIFEYIHNMGDSFVRSVEGLFTF